MKKIKSTENVANINISTNTTDYLVALTKGGVGAIPLVGSLAAEIISALIPNQRMDRIAKYLTALDKKLEAFNQDLIIKKFKEPGFIDLFEDSLHQVIRALSQERIEQIAALIKNGLTDEQEDYIRYKYLLLLFSELNEVEVLFLKYYSLDFHPDLSNEFWQRHVNILQSDTPFMGSPQEDVDRHTIQTNYKVHMLRLGLLSQTFAKPKKNELPEFDEKTGMVKAKGYKISPLGRLLIRELDLEEIDKNQI